MSERSDWTDTGSLFGLAIAFSIGGLLWELLCAVAWCWRLICGGGDEIGGFLLGLLIGVPLWWLSEIVWMWAVAL